MKPIIRLFLLNALAFCLVLAVLSPVPASADELRANSPSSSKTREAAFNPGVWLLKLYRNTISSVDSDRCPSFPSCSQYSLDAFRKHGFFTGWVMTVDRLLHEGKEETSVSPMVYSGGRWKIYDPVENNDFWWYHPPKSKDHD